jgi:hypothetical protein
MGPGSPGPGPIVVFARRAGGNYSGTLPEIIWQRGAAEGLPSGEDAAHVMADGERWFFESAGRPGPGRIGLRKGCNRKPGCIDQVAPAGGHRHVFVWESLEDLMLVASFQASDQRGPWCKQWLRLCRLRAGPWTDHPSLSPERLRRGPDQVPPAWTCFYATAAPLPLRKTEPVTPLPLGLDGVHDPFKPPAHNDTQTEGAV